MATLQKAIKIAVAAHEGQTRRNGEPYVLHPLRVMLKMTTEEQRIVAVLHDVVEDTAITLDGLLSIDGFSKEIVEALRALTKKDELYMNYMGRVAVNKLATAVKIEDLRDNLDLGQLDKITSRDVERSKKYITALGYLLQVQKGIPFFSNEDYIMHIDPANNSQLGGLGGR